MYVFNPKGKSLHTSFINLKHINRLINKNNNWKWESPTCDVNSQKLWTLIRDIDDQLRYIFPLLDNHWDTPRDSWVHQKQVVAKMGKVRWWKHQIYVVAASMVQTWAYALGIHVGRTCAYHAGIFFYSLCKSMFVIVCYFNEMEFFSWDGILGGHFELRFWA